MYKSGMIDASTAMQMMADLAAKPVSPATPATPQASGNVKEAESKKRPHSAVEEDEVAESDVESIEGHIGSHLVSRLCIDPLHPSTFESVMTF